MACMQSIILIFISFLVFLSVRFCLCGTLCLSYLFGLARSPDPPRGPCGIRRLGYPPYPGSGPLPRPPQPPPEARLPGTPQGTPGDPQAAYPQAPPKAPPRTPPPRPRPRPTRLPTPPTLASGFRKVPGVDPIEGLDLNSPKHSNERTVKITPRHTNDKTKSNKRTATA